MRKLIFITTWVIFCTSCGSQKVTFEVFQAMKSKNEQEIALLKTEVKELRTQLETQPPPTERVVAQPSAVSPFPLPTTLYFAGEAVPLDNPDIRERLERELHVHGFRHSMTMTVILRSGRWKNIIQPILRENGIPEDFFYLACAESDLDNLALSSASALGMWQFLAETAKENGLEVSRHVDERKDPFYATKAACSYLKDAYQKFGSWTSVAASYNRGITGLRNAFDAQKVDNYYQLYLNKQTYKYVFRILALKLIIENPEKYGFVLNPSDYHTPLRFREVKITERIDDLPAWAISKRVNYKVLKIYNPWLDSPTYELPVANGKTYIMRLPR